jgi:hypothetical protein
MKMDSNLPPPLTHGQARIREKLAHLTPEGKVKALAALKQVAQHQEGEQMALAASSEEAEQGLRDAPLIQATQAQVVTFQGAVLCKKQWPRKLPFCGQRN